MSEIESKEWQTKPDCREVAVQNSPDCQEVAVQNSPDCQEVAVQNSPDCQEAAVQTHGEATAAETIGRSTTFVICNIQMGLGAACLMSNTKVHQNRQVYYIKWHGSFYTALVHIFTRLHLWNRGDRGSRVHSSN